MAAVAALLAAAPAAAGTGQETVIQDDPLVLSAATQAEVDQAFASLKAVGADRVRVSLFWDHVAPERLSQSKPPFPAPGPSAPEAYPAGSWDRYDRIVLAARKARVGLLFSITGPGPAWATPGIKCRKPGPFRGCEEGVFRPDPSEFRDFALAAGTRYSGSYAAPPPLDPIGGAFGLSALDVGRPFAAQPVELPRVDHWSIWNEPNFPSWLLPTWRDDDPDTPEDMVPAAPATYRRLAGSAFAGLAASGHGRDTILIGETAPRGYKDPSRLERAMRPAEFVRELFCVDAGHRPYRGRDARLRDCPVTSAQRLRFASENPALFRSEGWAHHPYSLDRGTWHEPPWSHPSPDNVSIGSLGRLTRALDGAQAAWLGDCPPKSIWITEYGYQTSPADPTAGVSPERQGSLGAWGELLAYDNPRVASFAQYLLLDDVPLEVLPEADPARWVTWQSGLLTSDGEPKPHFDDFRLPLHVASTGAATRVFGAYRPADRDAALTVQLQFAAPGGAWRTLRTETVSNARGYLDTRVTLPEPGWVRLVWRDPATGRPATSRAGAAP